MTGWLQKSKPFSNKIAGRHKTYLRNRDNLKSEIFKTREELNKEEDYLSRIWMTWYMDDIIKEARQKTKVMSIGCSELQPMETTDCAFTNDIVIIANSEELTRKPTRLE